MAQNKHITKRRIICILCASIIALYALAIPIGAVVNSSQVPEGSASLYAQSTFPFTIGFVQNDQNSNNNYIFATEVGGLGQNNQVTTEGDDVFYWVTPDQSNEVASAIRYYFDPIVYPNEYKFVSGQNQYNRGYGTIRFEYDTITSGMNLTTESIILKAYDLYYNPMFTMDHETEAGAIVQRLPQNSKGWMYMVPTITLPTRTDYSTQAIVGRYNVEVLIVDQDGNKQWHIYSQTVDTRLGDRDIQAINLDLLASYANPSNIRYNESGEVAGSNSTILIEEFRAFLDVDYYEYKEAQPELKTFVLRYDRSVEGVETNVSSTFNYVDGMTWGDFISSPYNTANMITYNPQNNNCLFNYNGGVYQISDRQWDVDGDIKTTDVINLPTYYCASVIIGGGSNDSGNGTDEGPSAGDFWRPDDGPSATTYDVTPTAEERTWEIVDNDIINEITVTYPMYNISTGSPTETTFQKLWLSYPDASKYFDSITGEVEDYAPIPEDMYQDYSGWLANGVGGFFKAQLFPGISLGGIVGILIMFGCTMAILKIFAGG